METAKNTKPATNPIVIIQPQEVTPIKVDIILGAEYPEAAWSAVTETIDAAEAEVIATRAIKRQAEMAYETAMTQREAVQVPRDQMIATDRRTPARVSRLAGIGRARCSQIRIAILKKMGITLDANTVEVAE